jgi:hypothetical protein
VAYSFLFGNLPSLARAIYTSLDSAAKEKPQVVYLLMRHTRFLREPGDPIRSCVLTALLFLSFCDLAAPQSAAPHYVASTVAGHIPPDTGIALTQYLDSPAAVVYDAQGTLYFATLTRIWRLNAGVAITLVSGTGSFTSVGNGDGGPATQATFGNISALAFDPAHNLFVADWCTIRRITPDGSISTFAGTGNYGGPKSNAGGPAASVGVCPGGLAASADTLYAGDISSNSIITFSFDGTKSSIIAGNNGSGGAGDGGPAKQAQFAFLTSLALWNNKLLMLDIGVVRQIDLSTGRITTIPGVGASPCGVVHYFCYFPDRLAVSSDGKLYLNSSPDYIDVFDLVNGTAQTAFVSLNPSTNVFPPLTEFVRGLAVSPLSGAVAFADQGTHKISLATAVDTVQTLVGITHFSGNNDPAPFALLDTEFNGFGPAGIDVGTDGTIYFTDGNNNRVRNITTDGQIHTIAGTGIWGYAGDGGPAVDAQFYAPADLRLDAHGNLYVVDTLYGFVRKIDSSGVITTVAGSRFGTNIPPNGAPATQESLPGARSLAVDAAGNLYIGTVSNLVWKVDTSGLLWLVAGANPNGGFSGDGGPAINANLRDAACLATDRFGNLYICDLSNNRVRKIDSQGIITTVAGNGNFPAVGRENHERFRHGSRHRTTHCRRGGLRR